MVSTMNQRSALLLCLALLPAGAIAEPDPPLPPVAESARRHGELKILSIALKITSDKEIACMHWKMTKGDVRMFFQLAAPLDGEVWHHEYYVVPCDYVGKLQAGGETYDFVINGGSHGWLTTTSEPKIARLFGCPRGCQRIFGPFEQLRPGALPPEG
jgi:hypothetical protein